MNRGYKEKACAGYEGVGNHQEKKKGLPIKGLNERKEQKNPGKKIIQRKRNTCTLRTGKGKKRTKAKRACN